jgi:hypothetical protein
VKTPPKKTTCEIGENDGQGIKKDVTPRDRRRTYAAKRRKSPEQAPDAPRMSSSKRFQGPLFANVPVLSLQD